MSKSIPTIFLVDDNTDLLTACKLFLEGEGFRVFGFTNSRSALFDLERLKPDAMIVDINLPGNSGLWLAEQVQRSAKFQDMVLVAISGDSWPSIRMACLQSGFDLFIAKPFRFNVICENLRIVMSAGSLPRPACNVSSDSSESESDGLTGIC